MLCVQNDTSASSACLTAERRWLACAVQAMLTGGQWVRLLPDDHAGLAEVKWCMNRFVPFLVIDPHHDVDPGSRDAEEVSIEVRLEGCQGGHVTYVAISLVCCQTTMFPLVLLAGLNDDVHVHVSRDPAATG